MFCAQNFWKCGFAAFGFAAAVPLSSAQVVVLNDDFSAPVYSSFSFNNADVPPPGDNPADVSSETIGDVQSSGGNPGFYLELFHFHDVARDPFGDPEFGTTDTSLQSFFIEEATAYNPSVQGAIQSLTFSLDVRTTGPISTVFFNVDDANGGSSAGFMPVNADGQWQTITFGAATNADFGGRDFAGTDPLGFGFGFLSSLDVAGGEAELLIDVDNFVVTATLVPEPASLALVGLGVGAMTLRRRR